ncbi:hypothetical protein [Streptomyces sp. NPDC058867]|uniref:hypothetical protein n=1 Tax=unclassified Streptomyces TaxID=2593676 RepID=UPI0036AF275D
MFACACADVPGITHSTVSLGVVMTVTLVLLAAAILTAVFAAAWVVGRLLRLGPFREPLGSDPDADDLPSGPRDSQPGASGLAAFTWTRDDPADPR